MCFVGIFNYIFIFHIRIALFTSIPTTITTSPTTTTTITSNTTVGLIPKINHSLLYRNFSTYVHVGLTCLAKMGIVHRLIILLLLL